MSTNPPQRYRLRDGTILAMGRRTKGLYHFLNDTLDGLQEDHAFELERLLREGAHGLDTPLLKSLERDGMLLPGTPACDLIVRERLATLDARFVSPWKDRLSSAAGHAYERLLDFHAHRQVVHSLFGQAPVTPETALRRALLVGEAAQVGPKEVVCIGDDDMVSVALACLGHAVTVFDADENLLHILRAAADQHDLDITVHAHDFRDPLEADWLERFDILLTDPMSNEACLELFLSRGLAMLRSPGQAFVSVFGPTQAALKRVMQRLECTPSDWRIDFNRYVMANLTEHRYMSDWVAFEKTTATRLPVPADAYCVPENMYREQFAGRERSAMLYFANIEDTYHARPTFVHMILDGLEARGAFRFVERHFWGNHDRTVLHCVAEGGHVTFYIDRAARTMHVMMDPAELYPFNALYVALQSAYRKAPERSLGERYGPLWDVRLC